MDVTKLKETILRRASLEINDDFSTEECWNIEIEILIKDIDESIDFLKTCTEYEFYSVAEVFSRSYRKNSKQRITSSYDRYK